MSIKNKLPIVIIVLITLVSWHKILNQTLLGESYMYFDRKIAGDLWQYDNFARYAFDILQVTLKDNIKLYLGLQLVLMAGLNIVFYYTVKYFSKNKILSLSATLFFAVGYITSFEIWGIANYQRIIQRMPNLIFDLLALIQLSKYYEKKNKNNLILSLLLFSFALILGHFSIFMLPIFIFYPIAYFLYNKKSFKSLLSTTVIIALFVVINMFLLSRDPHATESGRWQTLLNMGHVGEQILVQISQMIVPLFLTKFISNYAKIGYPYTSVFMFFSLPICIISIVTYSKLKTSFKNIKFVLFYLTCLLSLPVMLLLNLQTSKVAPFTHAGYERYYLVPSFLTSIILATSIWVFFKSKKKLYKIAVTMIMTLFVIYNTTLIWNTIDENQYKSDAMRVYLSHVKSISQPFSNKTVLVMPSSLMWPAQMIETIYSSGPMTFIAFDEKWEAKAKAYNKNDVFVIDYNYKTATLFDLTQDYRNGKKIEYYQ